MDLYLDFDGVLLDTITVSYKMMEELGIDLEDRTKVIEFYKNLDWVNLLNISQELAKSFYYINEIYNEHIFNPRILTTVNSLNEMKAKIEALGGKVTGSVSSKTNFLLLGEDKKNSSKHKTAISLNIPILSEEDFNNML